MKINLIIVISFIVLIASSSCGRRNVGYGPTQQFYPQGFYYGNHFYDPRFYSFIPRGNRIIVIDDRTEQQVAAPRRAQVREVTDPNVARQPQRNTRQRRVEDDRAADSRRGTATETPRRRQAETPKRQTETRTREQATPRDARRSSPNVNQSPPRRTETRTAPPARPQNRSTGGTRPGSRRGN